MLLPTFALICCFPALAAPSVDSILSRFTGPDIPALGAEEQPVNRNWPVFSVAVELPGRGIAQHPMLYAGEGYNNILLVNGGKVVWSYSAGPHGEIDDLWMLSNGNILFASQFRVEEVTPQKKVVWRYDAPEGTELHTCQPIGLRKVLLVQNGLPPKLMIVNINTNKVEVEHALPAESLSDPRTVHLQFRRVRRTAKGTYLASFLRMNKVVEFDKHFRPIWSYEIPTPWAAARLRNGNTLVTDQSDRLVREVNRKGETVWEIRQSDLPADVVLGNIQTAERLANGDTVIFNSVWQVKREAWRNTIQALEVTSDKKLVWVLQDWNNLGPATTAQFLDQPGRPERPGDLQR
jgi:hypothetical protein